MKPIENPDAALHEPYCVNKLRNKLMADQTTINCLKNDLPKRIKRFDQFQPDPHKCSVQNLIESLTEHLKSDGKQTEELK